MTHTPAPWTKELTPGGYAINAGGDNKEEDTFCNIALVIEDQEDGDETEANARLISAAPDLLEALKKCFEIMSRVTFPGTAVDLLYEEARAAIQKAEGN